MMPRQQDAGVIGKLPREGAGPRENGLADVSRRGAFPALTYKALDSVKTKPRQVVARLGNAVGRHRQHLCVGGARRRQNPQRPFPGRGVRHFAGRWLG